MPGARVERAGDPEADRIDVARRRPAGPPRRRARPSRRARSGRGRAQGGWYGDGPFRLGPRRRPAAWCRRDRRRSRIPRPRRPPYQPPRPDGRRRRPPLHHLQGRARASSGPRRRPDAPRGDDGPDYEAHGRRRRSARGGRLRRGRGSGTRRPLTLGRVARATSPSPSAALGAALAGISVPDLGAQIQESKISRRRRAPALRRRATRSTRPTPCWCSAPTPAPRARKEAGANVIGQPSRSDTILLCASAAATTPRSRSRATPSSTSPATGATRSTPRTRSAARRWRSRPSRATSASTSTTSSRSTSRTSRS